MPSFDEMIQQKKSSDDDAVVVTTTERDKVEEPNKQERRVVPTVKPETTESPPKTNGFDPTQLSFTKGEHLSEQAREDSVFTTDKSKFADELINRLEQCELQFEGDAEPEEDTPTVARDYDTKTSRWTFNGAEVELDQLSLVYAEKRCKQYLDNISANSRKARNPIRTFYSDLIMLNLLTNRVLKLISPKDMERALSPIHYIKKVDKNDG